MTDLNQLVEVGARAQMASAAYSSFWSVADHKVMIKEGILAILPLLVGKTTVREVNEKLGNCAPTDAAPKRNIPHADGSRECHPVDAAPRYVFGPWVDEDKSQIGDDWLVEYKHGSAGPWRRAYRIGQTYEHDGGECPLADGSVRVKGGYHWCALEESADCALWYNVNSFTPLDQGSGR